MGSSNLERPFALNKYIEIIMRGLPLLIFILLVAGGIVYFVSDKGEDVSFPEGEELSTVVLCEDEGRGVFCTQQYQPVCGLTQVECVTTPCDPVERAYGNACTACSNDRVISYTEGLCDVL